MVVARSGELAVVRVDHTFNLERTVEVDWVPNVALSPAGVLARAGKHVAICHANSDTWVPLPDAKRFGARRVAFLGDRLLVFPGPPNELDRVLPWSWNGTGWEELSSLPPNEGWEDDYGWHLDGDCVEANGVSFLLWGGSVYRSTGAAFEKLGGGSLRAAYDFSLAPFGADIGVVSDNRVHLVRAGRKLGLGGLLISELLAAPGGSVLATCLRNDQKIAAVVLLPDGTTIPIHHAWFGTNSDDGWTMAPFRDALVGIRSDEGIPFAIPWSEVAQLPRGRATGGD
jgi:hypothetical protein